MIKKDRLSIFINGIEIPFTEIEHWEYQRLKKTAKLLQKLTNHHTLANYHNTNVDDFAHNIAKTKLDIGMDTLRLSLRNRYRLGNIVSMVAEKLSFGKRKFSITEIFVPNSSLTPQEVMDNINQIMMERNDEHDYMNTIANPDHYVLLGQTETRQEVLEITGGSPLPTRFFAEYGNETKLQSRMSSDYDVELSGVAKLDNGMVIGGMRHQVKKENNGFRFKALVEFPGLLPNSMIRQHQMHLACEFGHWISFVLDKYDA